MITTNNTVSAVLTKANVWAVDYENDYTYQSPNTIGGEGQTVTQDDQDYPSEPTRTERGESDFSCEHINELVQKTRDQIRTAYNRDHQSSSTADGSNNNIDVEITKDFTLVEYYEKYVSISDSITNTIQTQKYTNGVPQIKEKTDSDSDEPNFVTIYLERKNRKNRKNISSSASWLFEII